MTTATPMGLMASSTAMAICFVRRSWTWSRREKVSAIRASFERPRTNLFGMYPMETFGGGGGTLAYGVSQYKREGKKGLPCQ